jgi:hypothetical protein
VNLYCAVCNNFIEGTATVLCRPCAKSYDRQRNEDCTIDALLRWAGTRARRAGAQMAVAATRATK